MSPDAAKVSPAESVLRFRLVVVYGLASAAASAVMAALFDYSMNFELGSRAVFATWYAYAWPIIPTLATLLVLPPARTLVLLFMYILAGAGVVFLWALLSTTVLGTSRVSPFESAQGFLAFFVLQAWLPYTIILVTGNRRLRSVSPLVLSGLLVFSFGALALRAIYLAAFEYNPQLRPFLMVFGAKTLFLWFLFAALPIGYACWIGLRWLGRSYEDKRFSDLQFLVDSWWLIVIFQFCVQLASDLYWAGMLGLLAFVVYRAVVELGLRLWPLDASLRQGRRLLLLRVFGFQRRTERLFDAVGQRWRFAGTVMMIAGTDLAMRTINPGEIITFVSGRLQQQFVANNQEVRERLSKLDEARDPDGRFRITKFSCHADTWRPALQALLPYSDVVLMDLRGFSKSNSGCQFELEQLAANNVLARTVFVVDDTTDVNLLEVMVTAPTPNITGDDHSLNLQHVRTQSQSKMRQVYHALQTL